MTDYLSIVMGSLFVVSEILGTIDTLKPNGIVHGISIIIKDAIAMIKQHNISNMFTVESNRYMSIPAVPEVPVVTAVGDIEIHHVSVYEMEFIVDQIKNCIVCGVSQFYIRKISDDIVKKLTNQGYAVSVNMDGFLVHLNNV